MQTDPRLNLARSMSGTAIATISVQAIGQRFSARTPAVSTPDAGLRGALSRLRAHQSRTLASASAVAGGRSAASASAIRTRGVLAM